MTRILLVDDEPAVRFTLSEVIEEHGLTAVAVAGGAEALAVLDEVDAVITDLSMPEMDGFDLLARARARRPELPVIVLTARGSERAAVRAIKEGAYDYLSKPFDVDELRITLDRALETVALRRRERRLEAEVALGRRIVAEHPSMLRVLDTVSRVAGRDVPVLITGESGTGKELIAGLLHEQSRRRRGPFVRFNCAALPAELAEAELFGFARGAFTGAVQAKRGYFAQAHGGTLLLDEIGELSPTVQAKLLRALQEGEIQPLGAPRVERVDVRVLASTHRDLESECRAGRFRQDLYYRLAVVVVRVPALRERRSDIARIARELAAQHARRLEVPNVTLTDELVLELERRPWPGNVRELENTLVRLIALSDGGPLDASSLDPAAAPAESAAVPDTGLRGQLAAFERQLLDQALSASAGNQSEAARRLGLSRPTFIARARRFGLL